VVKPPSTRYARSTEGDYLAYQVAGSGPIDTVVALTGGLCADLIWDEPPIAAILTRLASFGRVITFDARGFGSSGRVDPNEVPAVQTWMDDIVAVMDAAQCTRGTLLGWAETALALMLFAATHPERAERLVLANPYARFLRSDECPWGMPADVFEDYLDLYRAGWGTGAVTAFLAPSLVTTTEARERWGRNERLAGTPEPNVPRAFMESDVTHVLPSIQAPTLVISCLDNQHVRREHGRFVAERIAGARLLEVAGADTPLLASCSDETLDAIQEFVTGVRPAAVSERQLATVLFTDIVSSTERAASLGDSAWSDALDRFEAVTRRELGQYRGVYVKSTGDGTLATFDGPARAIGCARAIGAGVGELGLELRAGLHTGEIERRDDDVAGLAVHIAARVASLAGAGEVLVSRTVTDLVAGSGIAFTDRGEHELKGVPGQWRLYVVDEG
jgi:class 3 adenylate cyclase